jgi:hypothetical protein
VRVPHSPVADFLVAVDDKNGSCASTVSAKADRPKKRLPMSVATAAGQTRGGSGSASRTGLRPHQHRQEKRHRLAIESNPRRHPVPARQHDLDPAEAAPIGGHNGAIGTSPSRN